LEEFKKFIVALSASAEITEQNTDEYEIKCGLQQLTHGRILYHSVTALIHAARKGHLQCVERQLEDGQNVNMLSRMNSRDTTALHAAASGGHRDIAKYLLDHGADIHARRAQGSTALHDAAKTN
jgi:ankyrin repeat protein